MGRSFLESSLECLASKERYSVLSCSVWKLKPSKKQLALSTQISVRLSAPGTIVHSLTSFQTATVLSSNTSPQRGSAKDPTGCSIFTSNGASGRQFQREVNVGMVSVNNPHNAPQANFSFSSNKASFLGGKSSRKRRVNIYRINIRNRNQLLRQ
jgi:hypothetical protein